METVYLETTFISYLVALPSRDILVAAKQHLTKHWWATQRPLFECVVSDVVFQEIRAGDQNEANKREAIANALTVLQATAEALELAELIVERGVLPRQAGRDATHLAVAVVHQIDFLLTWNCKHLANAQIMRRIDRICQQEGWRTPIVCTPEELMGELGE